MAISLGLGGLYFATAKRIYQAESQMIVRHSQSDDESVSVSADRATQDQMATFQKLVTSSEILGRALDRLEKLPPEIKPKLSREEAIEVLKRLVVPHTLRGTSIIEVDAQSESPTAAYSLVDAVVASYIEYVDENHRSVAADSIRVIAASQSKVEDQLQTKEAELTNAKQMSVDLGTDENADFVHPVMQHYMELGRSLAEVRRKRVQTEASYSALRQTIVAGGDMLQHLIALEPLIGKEVLLTSAGINPQVMESLREADKELLDLRAKKEVMSQYYGERHNKMVEIVQQIQAKEIFQQQLTAQLDSRLDGSRGNAMGQMLVNLLEEELASARLHEANLRRERDLAEQEALVLSNQRVAVERIEREVERLREWNKSLRDKMEAYSLSQQSADVRASVISPATMPHRAVHPVLLRILFLCIVLGSGCGVLVVYVMDVIDDRFRSPEELQEQLGVPVLAMVRKHESGDGSGIDTLHAFRNPDAVASEAFRTLRTTLAFSGQECTRLVVTSSEPSDGKTTVLSNLGVSYAQSGRRTLLIDCDLRKPGLSTLFGKRNVQGVSDILKSHHDITEMCSERVQSTGLEGLDLIPSGRRPADSAELLSRDRFLEMIAWAESVYDQILIDSPPVLAAADAAIAARQVDGVIVVVQPQKNHRRLVLRAFEGLASLGVTVLGTVVNAVGEEDGGNYYGYGGYGYGYGYGHGYGSEEEVDQDQAAAPRPTTSMSKSIPSSAKPLVGPETSLSSPEQSPEHAVRIHTPDDSDDDLQASLARISKFVRKAS
jgi:polysaccharide biosynthesis transport protein